MLLACLFAFAGSKAPIPTGTPWPTPVPIAVEDGTTVAADWALPANATNAVVLVHMNGRNRQDWNAIASTLARSGVGVVTLDLRKHGANVVAGSGGEVTPADYLDMLKDVRAAVQFIEGKGVERVILVGAEVGANLAVNVATEDPKVVGLALLSPGLDYKGIIAADAVTRYGNRALLIVVSNEDAYAAKSALVLDGTAKGEHEIHVLENAGKGTKMFNREPALEGFVVGWISTHWKAGVAARATPTTVDIPVEGSTVKTTGPSLITPSP